MTTNNLPAEAAKPQSKDIKSLIKSDSFKEQVAASLPRHLTPDRFVRVALTAMMRTPKLAECTQASLFKCLLDLSYLGLEPDGRRAYLIPYNNNKTSQTEAQLMIDYKGLIELAKRSGEVISWRAELVCANDIFHWDNGLVTHKVDWLKSRGETLAVYSHVKNKDGIDEYEVMTKEQVERIRKRSKSANNGPWVTDWDEMAKKTVIRRHSKKLTLSPEFNDAVVKDDETNFEFKKPTPDFDYQEMMPTRLSEVAQEETVQVAIINEPEVVQEKPVEQVVELKKVEVKTNPDDKISTASMTKIMDAMKANPSFTRDSLMSYIKSVWGKTKLTELLEKHADDVIKFIGKPPREPGCDDE